MLQNRSGVDIHLRCVCRKVFQLGALDSWYKLNGKAARDTEPGAISFAFSLKAISEYSGTSNDKDMIKGGPVSCTWQLQ